MKKKYEKPVVFYEEFELTESVAGNCTLIFNHEVDNCHEGGLKPGFDNRPYLPFTAGIESCVLGPSEDYCYYNSESLYKGFNS